MTSVKVSGQIRRRQIVDATLKIISEKGVSNLTTAAIANEAGMSEANLYRHFVNKEEILTETVALIGEGLHGNIEKVFHSGESPLACLREIYLLHLDFVENNAGIPRLVFSEEIHGGNSILKEIMFNTVNGYAAKLDSLLRNGQVAGLIEKGLDPSCCALTMIGMVQVTILRWSLSGFSFSLKKEGLNLWNNFEKCLVTKDRLNREGSH